MTFLLAWIGAFCVLMFLSSAFYSKVWIVIISIFALIAYIIGYFAHNKEQKRVLYRQRLRATRKYKKLLKGG